MGDLMGGKMCAPLETLLTYCTLIGLFPSMDPLVFFQITHLLKALSTLRTLMGLFNCMYFFMYFKMRHLTKGLSTVRTLMWKSMYNLMDVEF